MEIIIKKPNAIKLPSKIGGEHFIFGHVKEYLANPHRFLQKSWEEGGDVFQLNMIKGKPICFVNPEHIKHILVDNFKNYPKSDAYDSTREIFGEGLVVVKDTEKWKKERRVILPAFHKKYYDHFVDTMVRKTEKMAIEWRTFKDSGRTFNLHTELKKLSGQIIGEVILSSEVKGQFSEIAEAFSVLSKHAFKMTTSLIVTPKWLPSPTNRRFNKAKSRIERMVNDIIDSRENNTATPDLLNMLMTSVYEDDGSPMDRVQIKNELYNLFFAGYETTTNSLVAIFVLLHKHPKYQEKLREEIRQVLNDEPLQLKHLRDMKQVLSVIKEALRLYPPLPLIGKQALEDDIVGDYFVPQGNRVFFCPSLTHQHPDFWDNPTLFIPGRFQKEKEANRLKCSFIPFSSGPRVCTGKNFAYMEMQIILALLLPKFTIKLVNNHPYELDWQITTIPRYPPMAYLEEVK